MQSLADPAHETTVQAEKPTRMARPRKATDPSEPRVRKPRNAKPAHGTVRLSVTINGTLYGVRPIPIDPSIGSKAWRLRKAEDGTVYHVARLADGTVNRTCPSYEFDHK